MKFNTEHLMNHTTKLRKIEENDLQPNRKYIIVDVYKTCHYVGIFDEYTTMLFLDIPITAGKESIANNTSIAPNNTTTTNNVV